MTPFSRDGIGELREILLRERLPGIQRIGDDELDRHRPLPLGAALAHGFIRSITDQRRQAAAEPRGARRGRLKLFVHHHLPHAAARMARSRWITSEASFR